MDKNPMHEEEEEEEEVFYFSIFSKQDSFGR
jgi:hypothetical protein